VYFSKICREIQVSLKPENNKEHFTYKSIVFKKWYRLLDNLEKYYRAGQATDGSMAVQIRHNYANIKIPNTSPVAIFTQRKKQHLRVKGDMLILIREKATTKPQSIPLKSISRQRMEQ
jgi:hypothetical protein